MRNMQELVQKLENRPNPQDWISMAKFTMTRLILVNKRRRAEVRELKVDEYLARPKWHKEQAGEMSLALSSIDRLLAERYFVALLRFIIIFDIDICSSSNSKQA